jgi:geranylgeranyl pyrophosphate synthase
VSLAAAVDRPQAAVAALRAAVSDLHGRLGAMISEAVDHFGEVIRTRPPGAVAAVDVPIAVFRCLTREPAPPGLLVSGAATYLALDILDDQMDGDEPAYWRGRTANEVVLGAQMLLLTASQRVADGAMPCAANRMPMLYREMIARVIEGQLRTEQPLTASTTPADVAAAISARSGAMLAGFAALAAVAAGAPESDVEAARTFGHELAVARQHLNDITELAGDRTADLRNRTPTMAAALALDALSPARRETLIDSMRAAAVDEKVRRRLVRGDLAAAIAQVCILIQLHLGEARMAAGVLSRGGMGQDGLDRLIEFTANSLRRNNAR